MIRMATGIILLVGGLVVVTNVAAEEYEPLDEFQSVPAEEEEGAPEEASQPEVEPYVLEGGSCPVTSGTDPQRIRKVCALCTLTAYNKYQEARAVIESTSLYQEELSRLVERECNRVPVTDSSPTCDVDGLERSFAWTARNLVERSLQGMWEKNVLEIEIQCRRVLADSGALVRDERRRATHESKVQRMNDDFELYLEDEKERQIMLERLDDAIVDSKESHDRILQALGSLGPPNEPGIYIDRRSFLSEQAEYGVGSGTDRAGRNDTGAQTQNLKPFISEQPPASCDAFALAQAKIRSDQEQLERAELEGDVDGEQALLLKEILELEQERLLSQYPQCR